jgi:hypothetical protein
MERERCAYRCPFWPGVRAFPLPSLSMLGVQQNSKAAMVNLGERSIASRILHQFVSAICGSSNVRTGTGIENIRVLVPSLDWPP